MIRRDAGLALPAALWILVLIAALSATYLERARAERRGVAAYRDAVVERWAARAGLALALAELEPLLGGPGAAGTLHSRGDTLLGPIRIAENGLIVSAALLDARARLPLDMADSVRLARLFGALGFGASTERLVAALLDWRDADTVPRPGGAERPAYARERPPPYPPDRPFASVGELRFVRGFEGAAFRRAAPYLVTSGDGRINANSAAWPVLATLPGIAPAGARELIAARAKEPFRNVYDLIGALAPERGRLARARLDELRRSVAFAPRGAELVIAVRRGPTGPPGEGSARVVLRADVELEGSGSWRLLRVLPVR